MLRLFPLTSSLFLSACVMVGPDYHEPVTPVTSHWKKNSSAVNSAPLHDANWWKVFHDPTLTTLIYQGYQGNLSVQIAGAHVLQTRAQLAQAVGELYPQQQGVAGNYTYQRIGGSSLQQLLPNEFQSTVLGVSSTWEIDFWGKYRRAIQSKDASFLASLAAYDNALVSLTADVATAYINVRTYQELIGVTQQNIYVQTQALRIARSRFNAGQTSLLDVEQAKTELAETQAALPPYVSSLQQQKDALTLLLGLVPNSIDPLLKKSLGIPHAPRTVEVGIPKETLGQRPDIHQARLDAIAQLASIGAIKANLYPALSLSGTFAFAATTIGGGSLGKMFNWSNRNINAASLINWSLFNYGQITNAVRAQDAVFQQALLNYQNVVLKAQQEVQDNITLYIEAKKAERALTRANNSAIMSTKLAIIRYKEGEADFTTVLNAEQQQLRVQTSLTNARGNIAKALVALYRALGGGWQIRGDNDVVPGQVKQQMAQRTNWGHLLEQQNHQPPETEWQQIKQLYFPNW